MMISVQKSRKYGRNILTSLELNGEHLKAWLAWLPGVSSRMGGIQRHHVGIHQLK
jgi:hypothetical protein